MRRLSGKPIIHYRFYFPKWGLRGFGGMPEQQSIGINRSPPWLGSLSRNPAGQIFEKIFGAEVTFQHHLHPCSELRIRSTFGVKKGSALWPG